MPRVANWTAPCAWCNGTIEVGDDIYFVNGEKVCGLCADDQGYACPNCGEPKNPKFDRCYPCKQLEKKIAAEQASLEGRR